MRGECPTCGYLPPNICVNCGNEEATLCLSCVEENDDDYHVAIVNDVNVVRPIEDVPLPPWEE